MLEFSSSLQPQLCGGDCPPLWVPQMLLYDVNHQSDYLPSKTVRRKCVLTQGITVLLSVEKENTEPQDVLHFSSGHFSRGWWRCELYFKSLGNLVWRQPGFFSTRAAFRFGSADSSELKKILPRCMHFSKLLPECRQVSSRRQSARWCPEGWVATCEDLGCSEDRASLCHDLGLGEKHLKPG